MNKRCVLPCPDCEGWGGEEFPSLDLAGNYDEGWEPCERCRGTGKVGPVFVHSLEPGPGR
jgi:hypothetical protein